MTSVPLDYFITLSVILFTLGGIGVIVRKNAMVIFMSIEMMLNSANLLFVVFALRAGTPQGHAIAFFVMAIAAAEAVVGLAIFVALYRHSNSVFVDDFTDLAETPEEHYEAL